MEKFTEFFNNTQGIILDEAKANLDKKLKITDNTIGDILQDLYNKFGTSPFKGKDAPDLKDKYIGRTLADQIIILAKWNMLEKTSAGYNVTSDGEAAVLKMGSSTTSSDDSSSISTAKVIKNLGKTKTVKFKVPKVSKSSKYFDQMTTLLDHMDSTADGITKKTYMLAGDPGTGKTSFIESLGTLTGIPLVVIEAPHITQEHLINIPFLVIDGPKRREGNITIQDSENPTAFKIVQAESALVTTLKAKKKRTDNQVQTFINKNKVLREMQPKLQYEIDLVKDRFNAILFLDEFYRTTSKKIRNVLRNILNGKIGDDKIPKGTYIIMATNINDEGIDDIPENHDFNLMKYDTPDKDDLFNYFYGKYVDTENIPLDAEGEPTTRTGIKLKPEVYNGFWDGVMKTDLGKNDEEADVRLSPRRLEQMLIYVDSQTPCATNKDAQSLISYMTNALSNYLEDGSQGKSNMVDQYVQMTKKIIKETSPNLSETTVDSLPALGKTEWGKVLDSQIDAKITLGESKKYVPIVSGDPGIGKTTAALRIADSKNMGFIQIDISNRSAEDFSGMPNADMGGEEITVQFTEPALYRLIMKDYEALPEAAYKGAVHTEDGWTLDGNIIDRAGQRPYNVILLFDEMNRTSPAVFNSMRKILLEKQFSDNYILPPDIMMMGAINPKGEGTIEFTSHTRDVLDIIPASADFSNVMNYAKNVGKIKDINAKIGFDLSGTIARTMSMLADDFHSQTNSLDDEARILESSEQPFWWTMNGQIVYISGREFTEALFEITVKTQKSFRRMGWDVDAQYTEQDYDKFIAEAINIFAKYLGMGLNMVVVKMDVEDFVPQLQGRIINDIRIKTLYKLIKDKKSIGEISLTRMLEASDFDANSLGKAAIGSYIRYTSPTQMTQDIQQSIDILLQTYKAPIAVSRLLKITAKIKKSLKASSANFEYTDKLNKHIKSTLAIMMEKGALPLVEVMRDESLMSEIEQLTIT